MVDTKKDLGSFTDARLQLGDGEELVVFVNEGSRTDAFWVTNGAVWDYLNKLGQGVYSKAVGRMKHEEAFHCAESYDPAPENGLFETFLRF